MRSEAEKDAQRRIDKMKKLEKILILFCTVIFLSSSLSADYFAATVAGVLTNADPVMLLTGYKITEGQVEIGEEFSIEITIQNMNRYATAYNVVVDTTAEDMNLRLVNGGVNQIYYESIAPGATKSFTQRFKLEEGYPYNTAQLIYTFYYCGSDGDEYDNRTIITPAAITPCKLNLNVLSVASTAIVGSRSLVNVRCTNDGSRDIDRITMKIDGNILDSQKKVELGSLEANEQVMQDCYVNFTEAGEQTLSISFEYVDKSGNVFTIDSQSYTVNVNESKDITIQSVNEGSVTINGKKYTSVQVIIVTFIGIIVFACGVTFISSALSKRKEKKTYGDK